VVAQQVVVEQRRCCVQSADDQNRVRRKIVPAAHPAPQLRRTVPPPLEYIGPANDLGESIHLALKHLLRRAQAAPLDIAIAPLLALTIFDECLLK
jgi:hypothetical protein